MKKLLIALFLMGTAPVLPAKANPVATDCFNSLIEHPSSVPDKATLLLTVDHAGGQYHVIEKYFSNLRQSKSSVYLRTDSQGGCKELMSYQEGSHPEVEVYRERLGTEVFEKIKQAFKQRRAQESKQ